jgi:hypothetical protein
MKRFKTQQAYFALIMLVVSVLLITGCGSVEDALQLIEAESGSVAPGTNTCLNPQVLSSNLTDEQGNVGTGTTITATFNEEMNPATILSANAPLTFTLKDSSLVLVERTVIMNDPLNTIATLTPEKGLAINTRYTVTITKSAMSALGNSLNCSYKWHFTTGGD